MLTKTLNFDEEVLTVLRQMEWSADGLQGKIVAKLERKLYEKVNKALDAMGGKWNRKAGAHLFQLDPRSKVDGLLGTDSLTVVRDGFFETPRPVIDRMLELCPLPSIDQPMQWILEPSAGIGAILDVLLEQKKHTYVIHAVEKNPDRRRALLVKYLKKPVMVMGDRDVPDWDGSDFLTYKPFVSVAGTRAVYVKEGYDRIYMNPPFEELQDIDHVYHAYSLLAFGGSMVSVMSESPFFRSDNRAVNFREWLAPLGIAHVLPDGSFKSSGTGVNARLVVIHKKVL